MSTTLTLRQAQAQLPDLVERAVKHARPCFIRRHGRPVAVLVSLREWRRGNGRGASSTASAQERRIRAYQRKMGQLGPDYWLPPDRQARLKHPVEKQGGGPLTGAERPAQFAHRPRNMGAGGCTRRICQPDHESGATTNDDHEP